MARRRTPSAAALAKLGLRAAGVAHDLAQPLTAALLAARQVDGKGAGPLRAALHRMEDLLLEIRSELRPSDDNPRRRPADLAEVRRALVASLTPAERRRTRIRLAGATSADATALLRILGNLVLNALRHGRGPVRVDGTARGPRVDIRVEGGAGKRPENTGWGIGLASCQDLANRHRLALRIEISPTGSKATLTSRS